jgi:hypothetical protein
MTDKLRIPPFDLGPCEYLPAGAIVCQLGCERVAVATAMLLDARRVAANAAARLRGKENPIPGTFVCTGTGGCE